MRTFDTSVFVSWSGPVEGLADELAAQLAARNVRVIKGGQGSSPSRQGVSPFFPERVLEQMRKETTHAIFLLAPDVKPSEPRDGRFFFRDNVMFEAGYLMRYLPARANFVFPIGVSHRDLPSDLCGIEAEQVPGITLQDIADNKTRHRTSSENGSIAASAQFICNTFFRRINDRLHNYEDLARPINAFRDYSKCKALLRAQIDGVAGPNAVQFSSTLLCMAPASAYTGESELLLRWCREALGTIKTARWESYLMIARNILEWYVSSDGLNSIPPIEKLHSFVERIVAWEAQHNKLLTTDTDRDLLLLVHTQLYKHHVYRRIAMHPESRSVRVSYLTKAWICLDSIMDNINQDTDPLWADSKMLWKGFTHFMFCRCWFDMGQPENKKDEVHAHLTLAIQARLIIGDRLASQDDDFDNRRLADSYKLETLTNSLFEMVHWRETLDPSKIIRIAKALEKEIPQNQGWSRLLKEFRRDVPEILGEEGASIVADIDATISSKLLRNKANQSSRGI